MDYIIVKQAAEKGGLSVLRVQQFCKAGRIPDAVRPARDWLIPKDEDTPRDTRSEWHKKRKR